MFPLAYNDKAINAVIRLVAHKSKKTELFDFMRLHAEKRIELNALRKRLSKINGSLAEEVIRSREERL